jgi:DNA-binding response OmpR family regulator
MVRTILIVDEDPSWVDEVAASVTAEGSTAHTASTFRDALRVLDTARPRVLVTGLRLGVYNGLHLLLRGRADNTHLTGIVVGPPDPFTEREAREFGATAYLARPVTPCAVVDEIRKIVAAAVADDGDCLSSAAALDASVG